MKALKIAFGVLMLATSFSGQAFAAAPADAEFSPDGVELCSFVADMGGYVCEPAAPAYSLSELSDGRTKKKPTILGPVGNPGVVQICCKP